MRSEMGGNSSPLIDSMVQVCVVGSQLFVHDVVVKYGGLYHPECHL